MAPSRASRKTEMPTHPTTPNPAPTSPAPAAEPAPAPPAPSRPESALAPEAESQPDPSNDNAPDDNASDPDSDDDPITATYTVYITPPLPSSSLYLLQFPTREREHPYNETTANAPLELRMKPRSGFLELDVPINRSFNYDAEKATTWGQALTKAKTEGASGHGIAAGFANQGGLRAAPSARGGGARGGRGGSGGGGAGSGRGHGHGRDDDVDDEEGPQMQFQTLGGQIVEDEKGRPNYMIGAFKGAELHLTPVNGLIQMRPQFHHIDAKNLLDRNTARRTREAAEGGARAAQPAEPRLVQMISKGPSSSEAENLEGVETTKEYLTRAADEDWTRMEWLDEEEERAYEAWHESMFLKETGDAVDLVAGMGDESYLDAISAPRLDPTGGKIVRPMTRKGKVVFIDEESEEDEEEVIERERPAREGEGRKEKDGGAAGEEQASAGRDEEMAEAS